MIFDCYYPFQTKEGKWLPGIKPAKKKWSVIREEWANRTATIIDDIRALKPEEKDKKAELKKQLPAICFTGSSSKTRANKFMTPTQLVMLDFDHVEEPYTLYRDIASKVGPFWFKDNVLLVHITPSGHGLRFVLLASDAAVKDNKHDLATQMEYFYKELEVEGDYDTDKAVKDFARLSFFCKAEDILYENDIITEHVNLPEIITNDYKDDEDTNDTKTTSLGLEVVTFSDEEKEKFEALEYRGTPVRLIIEKYVETYGKPTEGEIHNYYNELVKNFRNVCSNDKRALLYLLPRFGHTVEECYSQVKSICKVNTLSTLPKTFYFFLKDNGFYKPRTDAKSEQGALKEYMLAEAPVDFPAPPFLPPVFREYLRTAPKDFVLPAMNALLPMLGTLTSYVRGKYPYDDRYHTTSFFSIIYAPPGTGKSFVERFMDELFVDIKLRDYIQTQRENVYLRFLNKKGSNEKSPDMPHTSLRLIPAKNSEAEFLQKQEDNHGYHMFTYASEMDAWAKGVKAAGGNKDDMIRIAWDNGEYGQQFKSAATFKGTVRLYWNVLICGTIDQLERYFRNVENGLVTRCSFFSIDNQDFAEPPVWRKLSKRDLNVIRKFVRRCDDMTYTEPCTLTKGDLVGVNDKDFDKEIDWKFKFRERVTVDMEWLMPTIREFHKDQIKQATLDVDKARDVFRRRVAVRGFRLGLLCTCLWEKPTKKNLEDCTKFIRWWMDRDIENILKLWGAKYNELANDTPNLHQRSVFSALPETFSRNDVYAVCLKQQIKTPVRSVIFNWKKNGYISQIDKENFKKVKK